MPPRLKEPWLCRIRRWVTPTLLTVVEAKTLYWSPEEHAVMESCVVSRFIAVSWGLAGTVLQLVSSETADPIIVLRAADQFP